jgi:DNA uptake protein ComE-like DNA-binding protein
MHRECARRRRRWCRELSPRAALEASKLGMVRVLLSAALAVALVGCAPSNTQQLERRTADATAAAKRDAQAITAGVKEGLQRKGPVNINSASEGDLKKLPGVTPDLAARIVAKRPYGSTQELVHKRVMSRQEYDGIKNQIVAQ